MPFPRKYQKELKKEQQEHPWASKRVAERLVLNHHGTDFKKRGKKS
jgi:hypothetical protein